MRVTGRDQEIMLLIGEHRLLRTDHMLGLTLLFDKPLSEQMLYRRLRLLHAHGYVLRLAERHRGRTIYCLAERGAKLLTLEQGVPLSHMSYMAQPNEASGYFLEHTLRIADFRVALTLAVTKHGTPALQSGKNDLVAWTPEVKLRAQKVRVAVPGKAKPVSLIPDGLVMLQHPGRGLVQAFVEVDMATEQLSRFAGKVQAYRHYKSQGPHFAEYRSETPFVVLTATTGEERRDNLILTTDHALAEGRGPRDGPKFYFTTFDELLPERILGDAWKLANDAGANRLGGRFASTLANTGTGAVSIGYRSTGSRSRSDWYN